MHPHEVLHEGEGDVGILGALVEAVAAHAQAKDALESTRERTDYIDGLVYVSPARNQPHQTLFQALGPKPSPKRPMPSEVWFLSGAEPS